MIGVYMIALGIVVGSVCFYFNDSFLKKASLKEIIRNDAEIFNPEVDDKDYYFMKKHKIIKSNKENLNKMDSLIGRENRPQFNDREDIFDSIINYFFF